MSRAGSFTWEHYVLQKEDYVNLLVEYSVDNQGQLEDFTIDDPQGHAVPWPLNVQAIREHIFDQDFNEGRDPND